MNVSTQAKVITKAILTDFLKHVPPISPHGALLEMALGEFIQKQLEATGLLPCKPLPGPIPQQVVWRPWDKLQEHEHTEIEEHNDWRCLGGHMNYQGHHAYLWANVSGRWLFTQEGMYASPEPDHK